METRKLQCRFSGHLAIGDWHWQHWHHCQHSFRFTATGRYGRIYNVSNGHCIRGRKVGEILILAMDCKNTADNGDDGRATSAAKMVFVVFVVHVLSPAWGDKPLGCSRPDTFRTLRAGEHGLQVSCRRPCGKRAGVVRSMTRTRPCSGSFQRRGAENDERIGGQLQAGSARGLGYSKPPILHRPILLDGAERWQAR